MNVARLIFLFVLYLSLDIANPLMPGALVFSAEDSVEARSVRRLVADDITAVRAPALERLSSRADALALFLPVAGARRTALRRHGARPRRPSADPPAPAEDD